jgi:hypothetical protein
VDDHPLHGLADLAGKGASLIDGGESGNWAAIGQYPFPSIRVAARAAQREVKPRRELFEASRYQEQRHQVLVRAADS